MLALELLDNICSMVWIAEGPGKTLVALALTSRTMNEHATSHIWRAIPNLQPLVQCLPADLQKMAKDQRALFLLLFELFLSTFHQLSSSNEELTNQT
jgi:hypothetical protein